jgi:hypothetical protein
MGDRSFVNAAIWLMNHLVAPQTGARRELGVSGGRQE